MILFWGLLLQDETGVYKNLLQETAHRAGLKLPVYTTVRSGPGHVPVFSCTVELAGMRFTGEPARTKKQAQKNAAMAAWSALKKCEHLLFLYFIFLHSVHTKTVGLCYPCAFGYIFHAFQGFLIACISNYFTLRV
jgi:hypothetical protein